MYPLRWSYCPMKGGQFVQETEIIGTLALLYSVLRMHGRLLQTQAQYEIQT